MNDIFISVIVPIYNKKPFLKEALDSVKAALSGISGEVICMDNGSDDGSAEVLDDYVKENPRFQAFHMEKIGAAAARNIGIKKARGKYLAFVDADDKVTENLYRDMLYICETNNLNLCICNITRFEEKNKGVVSVQYQRAFNVQPKLITSIEESNSFIYDGSACNKLIRRDFWNDHGLAFPEVGHYEDMPAILKLFCAVDKFAVMHSFGYFWRNTPGGISISQQVKSFQTLKDRMEVCEEMLNTLKEKYGEDSQPAKFMINRLLCWEFDSNLWHIEELDEEIARAFCDELRDYFGRIIPEDALKGASIFNRKRYELIMAGDVEGLVRLMNHRRIGWRSAPIIEMDGVHYLKLPEDIYGQEFADASIELEEDLPLTRMSVFTQDGAKVNANIVLYQPRVNASKPDYQDVKAFLYNEHTGERIYLRTEPLKIEPWTKSYGRVICNDDYRVYNYNYDWAGVKLHIDFDEILKQDEKSREILRQTDGVKPRWLFFFEYKTPVLQGCRILRGLLPKARKSIPTLDITLEHEGEKYKYDFLLDMRESLFIEVSKA